jgi:hypothetical protein
MCGSKIMHLDLQVLNNLDWFGGMSFLGFLRDVGKYARVGTMLSKDSVSSRVTRVDESAEDKPAVWGVFWCSCTQPCGSRALLPA